MSDAVSRHLGPPESEREFFAVHVSTLLALDKVLDLAADVLHGETPATTEECEALVAELCRARGLLAELKMLR